MELERIAHRTLVIIVVAFFERCVEVNQKVFPVRKRLRRRRRRRKSTLGESRGRVGRGGGFGIVKGTGMSKKEE